MKLGSVFCCQTKPRWWCTNIESGFFSWILAHRFASIIFEQKHAERLKISKSLIRQSKEVAKNRKETGPKKLKWQLLFSWDLRGFFVADKVSSFLIGCCNSFFLSQLFKKNFSLCSGPSCIYFVALMKNGSFSASRKTMEQLPIFSTILCTFLRLNIKRCLPF